VRQPALLHSVRVCGRPTLRALHCADCASDRDRCSMSFSRDVELLTHHRTQLLPVTAPCIVSIKDSLCRTDEHGVPIKGASGKCERREVVKVPQEEGIPDGMTIDRCAISSLMVSSIFKSWP
jgi:hypothetical protein